MKNKRYYSFMETAVSAIISILMGLIVGGIVLTIAGYNPLGAYKVILEGIFAKPNYIVYTIIYATPLIMTGLSVAFSIKTGLLNIGAEGQYIIGSLVAVVLGAKLNLPTAIHIPVCIIGAMLAAGLWGGIAGVLRAKYNVNEVISTIMLNWVAFHLNNYIVTLPGIGKVGTNVTEYIKPTARIDLLFDWKVSEIGSVFRKAHPLIGDALRAPVNFGIILAIIIAVLVKLYLNRTTSGYALRVVGDNKNCAEYNGINITKSIILTMVICGMLAGAGGAFQVLGRTRNVAKLAVMEAYGFNGIAVALIAKNSAVGCVFSGLFFAALTYGGSKIQSVMGAPKEVVNIVIGTIIFFVAIPAVIPYIKKKLQYRKTMQQKDILKENTKGEK